MLFSGDMSQHMQVRNHTLTQMCSADNRNVRAPSYTYYSEAIAQTSFPAPFDIHGRFAQLNNHYTIMSCAEEADCTKLKISKLAICR